MSRHFTPQELVEGFAELHTLPEVYFRIKAVVDNPDSQVTDLVREVSTDPALTARILRVVNSPLYRTGGKVETVARAVKVLGTRAIHDLVLATSVTGMITRRALGELDLRTHWRESLAVAMVARALGEACRLVDRDRLFVAGLLSRLGQVVMYERIGTIVSVVARHASAKQLPLHRAQRSFLGCHFGEVGAALLRKWRLPESLCGAVAAHLDAPAAQETPDVGLLRLAAALAPRVEQTSLEAGLGDILTQAAPAGLPLDEAQAIELIAEVRAGLAEVLQVILPGAEHAA